MTDTKNIVITGASSGLGSALALAFAKEGHNVWGCGRSSAKVEELQSPSNGTVTLSVVDVTSDTDVAGWSSEVVAKAGHIDLLINNAGLINQPAPLWRISGEEFAAVIDVNVKGVGNVMRAFLPHMVERQQGVLVNLVSGSGKQCLSESGPYSASKWAVEALTKTLAKEIPDTMAAVALDPGTIDTKMLRRIIGDRAMEHEKVTSWVTRAAPFILGLGRRENGETLRVPGMKLS